MKLQKKIAKVLKNKDKSYFYRLSYFKYFKKLKIDEKTILLEPQQGRTINGNIFYVLKELAQNNEYKNYKINIALKEGSIESAKSILEYNEIHNVNIVKIPSKEYYILLAKAKYLITDTAFWAGFIKKEGQVILNTWHGTPLKYLGKRIKNNFHNIGNVQKNFMISDYLLYPNEYMKKHMIEDYMLENICNAKTIMCGYPRNTVFFDMNSRKRIREELEIEDKEVFVYMPTWREAENAKERTENATYLLYNLFEIEKRLKDNQILYVNLHPLERKVVNFNMFSKIQKFPDNYETYQFLNVADCLITDYSSVFFDFAVTKRKIILFAYDEEEYLSSRGLYFDYKKLPFSKARDVDELIKCINSEKDYDETEFLEKFCKYESKQATKKLCDTVILNKKTDLEIENVKNNGKKNILFYVGNLAKSGVTSSIRNILANVDLNENNYYITFVAKVIAKNKEQLLDFPPQVKYISTMGKTNMTILQKVLMKTYRENKLPAKLLEKRLKDIYSYEIKRLYGDAKFDTVVQFNGYEFKKILLYSQFDSNTVIYVHSDMLNEIKTRQNQHLKTLKYAYRNYKKVAIVNEDLQESTVKISNKKDNIYVAHNIIDYKNVLQKSEKEVAFDDFTVSNVTLEHLNEVLNSKYKKFVTIGRFSPEKGHERLIRAFDRIYKEDNECYLVIIGGNGKNYQHTLEIVDSMESKDNIILVNTVSNPYSILKKCDYFVLSSFYEGFGIVIAEADILKKPVVSTDIIGPRNFMKSNGGTLVENSEKGLYEGMKLLKNNKVKLMNVDYEKYNQKAIQEFYKLLEK